MSAHHKWPKSYLYVTAITGLTLLAQSPSLAQDDLAPTNPDRIQDLEEIIVSSERREKSLQDTPVAVTVLTGSQLANHGISSLDRFGEGIIPSLKVQPIGNTPSTLIIAIRGNGVSDATQITREAAVAIYQNGFYLGRTQGLSMELADPEREPSLEEMRLAARLM